MTTGQYQYHRIGTSHDSVMRTNIKWAPLLAATDCRLSRGMAVGTEATSMVGMPMLWTAPVATCNRANTWCESVVVPPKCTGGSMPTEIADMARADAKFSGQHARPFTRSVALPNLGLLFRRQLCSGVIRWRVRCRFALVTLSGMSTQLPLNGRVKLSSTSARYPEFGCDLTIPFSFLTSLMHSPFAPVNARRLFCFWHMRILCLLSPT